MLEGRWRCGKGLHKRWRRWKGSGRGVGCVGVGNGGGEGVTRTLKCWRGRWEGVGSANISADTHLKVLER